MTGPLDCWDIQDCCEKFLQFFPFRGTEQGGNAYLQIAAHPRAWYPVVLMSHHSREINGTFIESFL
jgi:hypothetical protein